METKPDSYTSLMEVVRNRMTNRAFDPDRTIPIEHYEMILEAARHAPSGANAQPWHYIVVTESETKSLLADRFKADGGYPPYGVAQGRGLQGALT